MENKMYEIFFTDCEGKLTVLKEPQDGCWINMLDPTAEEIDLISGLAHIILCIPQCRWALLYAKNA